MDICSVRLALVVIMVCGATGEGHADDASDAVGSYMTCTQNAVIDQARKLSPEAVATYGRDPDETAKTRFWVVIRAADTCRSEYAQMETSAKARYGQDLEATRYLDGAADAARSWAFYVLNQEISKSKAPPDASSPNQSSF